MNDDGQGGRLSLKKSFSLSLKGAQEARKESLYIGERRWLEQVGVGKKKVLSLSQAPAGCVLEGSSLSLFLSLSLSLSLLPSFLPKYKKKK